MADESGTAGVGRTDPRLHAGADAVAGAPPAREVLGVELTDQESGERAFYRDLAAVDRSELPAGRYDVTELRRGPAGFETRRSRGTISADSAGMQADGDTELGFLVETGATYEHVDPDGEVAVRAGAVRQERGVARGPVAGVDLEIELTDPDGNSVGTETATTNDSGNARVTFSLDGADPGMYGLEVRSETTEPISTDRLLVGPYTALPFHSTAMTVGEPTMLGVFSAVDGTPEEGVPREVSVSGPDGSEETLDVGIGTGGIGSFQFKPDAAGSYEFSGVDSPARGETLEAGGSIKAYALPDLRDQFFDDGRETMTWGALVVDNRVPVSNRDLDVRVLERRFGDPDELVEEFTPTTNDLGQFTIEFEKPDAGSGGYRVEIRTTDGEDVFLDNDTVFFRSVPDPAPPAFRLSTDGREVAPDQSVDVEGRLTDDGDPVVGETVSLLLTYSGSGRGEVPVDVVQVDTAPDGSISTTVEVPADAPDGEDFDILGSVELDGEIREAKAFAEIQQYAVDASDLFDLTRGETNAVDVTVRDRLSDDPVGNIDFTLFGNRDHVDAETFDAGYATTDTNGEATVDLTVPADAVKNVSSNIIGPYRDADSAFISPMEPFGVEVEGQPAELAPGDTVTASYTADTDEPTSAFVAFPHFNGSDLGVIGEDGEAEFEVPEYAQALDFLGAQFLVIADSGEVTRAFQSFGLAEGLSASFQFTPAEPRVGQPVEFEDTSTAGPDETIESYEWEFGDGATATGPQVTHTYDSLGEFTVSLTVTTAEGDSDTARTDISTSGGDSEFVVTPPALLVGEEATFDASGTTGEVESYEWAFGDGTTATGTAVTHAYDEWGLYEVSLTIQRPSGSEVTTQTIDVAVEDDRGDAGVTAALDYAPRRPDATEQVTFDASPSSGDITEYTWAFGDSEVTNGLRVTHAYEEPGEYEVELRVVDRPDGIEPGAGAAPTSGHRSFIDSTAATVRVEEGEGFTISNTEPTTLDTVTFDAGTGPAAAEARWQFGDGNGAVGAEVTHQYDSAGTFTVSVTVDGTTYERDLTVDLAPIKVTDVERDVGGTLLSNLPLRETFEADVETAEDTETDRVEFEIADDQKTVETPVGPPFAAEFPIETIDPPGDRLVTRGVSQADAVHERPEYVDVEALTPWLDFIVNGPLGLTVEETEDGRALLLTYDPLENVLAFVSVEMPSEVLASDDDDDDDGDDSEQSFDFDIDFGGSYDPLTVTADVEGRGEIAADLMRAEVRAGVFASGTITTDLELTNPSGGVEAEVGVTIPSLGPVPLSIPIPGTDSTIGIEPTITPGIAGEFFFTDNLEFQRGEITPSVEIVIEAGIQIEDPFAGVGSAGLVVSVGGDLDIQFDVGTDDPEPGGRITISGDITLEAASLVLTIGGEIYSIEFGEGVDLATQRVRSGTEYDLVPAEPGGPNPLPSVPAVDAVGRTGTAAPELGVTATDPRTVDRLTDREFEDLQPSIAPLDGEHVVVWSSRDEDKPVEAGRDIVARRFDGSSYDSLTAVTDDSRADTQPVVAANASGEVLAAWIVHDVDAGEIEDVEEFFAATELAYSVHDGSGWSEPQVLTDTTRVQQRPAVAADGDEWVVAWQSIDDAAAESAVRVGRFGADGTVTELDVRDDAANPDVGARADGEVDLAYCTGTGGTITGVTHEQLDGETTVGTESYDAVGATTVAAADGRLVWVIGQGDPNLETAEAGTRRELAVREEVTSVAELSLTSRDGAWVLSYRASVTGSPNRDLVYRLDRGDGWIRDRRIAGSSENALDLWYAETRFLDAETVATAYAVGEPGEDAVNDIVLTRQPFAPAYRIEGDVDPAATGEQTTVSYGLENLGDTDGSAEVTVRLTSQGETLATRSHSPLAVGEELSDSFSATVDDTGSFELAVEAAEPVLAEEQASVEVVAAEPALLIDGVETERTDSGALSVTVAVANEGGVPIETVPVRISDAGEQVALLGIDEIGGGDRESVSTTVDPAALGTGQPQTVVLAPSGTIPEDLLVRGELRTHLARPDLAVETARYRADDETFAEVIVSNSGPAAADATLELVDLDGGSRLHTTAVTVDPGAPDAATFTTATVPAPGLEEGDTVQVRLDPTVPDLDPSGLAQEAVVEAILPGDVSDLPPVVGEDPPRDLDGDGLYEDIDGDGSFTIGDVQQFFQNRDSDAVQNNPEAFNFDDTDTEEVTIGDVQALFQLFQEQR